MKVIYLLLLSIFACNSVLSFIKLHYYSKLKVFKLYDTFLNNNIDQSNEIISTSKFPSFSLSTALILAGYSFESYNEPVAGKTAIILDNKIFFQSTDYIRKVYNGLIMITLVSGRFSYSEHQLLEQLTSGFDPDPYIKFSMIDTTGNVIDSATSSVKNSQKECIWKENFQLYLFNPLTNYIKIEAFDKDNFKSDDFIGSYNMSIDSLLMLEKNKDGFIPLVVPLYTNQRDIIPIGELYLEVLYVPWEDNRRKIDNVFDSKSDSQLSIKESRLPRGGTPHLVDWTYLLTFMFSQNDYENKTYSTINDTLDSEISIEEDNQIDKEHEIHSNLIDSVRLRQMHQICHIENIPTDTQLSIWADEIRKQIIISFRGTEQVKFQDILTDINVVQSDYYPNIKELNGVKVHSGFYEAFKSILLSLLEILRQIMIIYNNNNSNGKWALFITGHSLGGALASLASFELGLLKTGIGLPNLPYNIDSDFLSTLSQADIIVYTYGAPRVGNSKFVEIYNNLLPNCYRIVNNKDIVCRMPRGSNAVRLIEYEHIGKTVVIDDDNLGLLWIEGQSIGSCPLAELSPIEASNSQINKQINFANEIQKYFSNLQLDKQIIKQLNNQIDRKLDDQINGIINGMKDGKIGLIDDIQKYFNDSMLTLPMIDIIRNITSNSLFELPEIITKFPSMSNTNLSDLINITISSDFISKEWQLFNALIDGTAVAHHLEPSYYQALAKIILSDKSIF